MTNRQSKKSNSPPTGIGGRFELATPVWVTRTLTTMPTGYFTVGLLVQFRLYRR